MPLYEYRCQSCGHTFEKIQKFSDKPQSKCPECGGRSKRLLSPSAIQFKGSGWYVTDYARKGKAREKDKRSEGSPEKPSGASGKDASNGAAAADRKGKGRDKG